MNIKQQINANRVVQASSVLDEKQSKEAKAEKSDVYKNDNRLITISRATKAASSLELAVPKSQNSGALDLWPGRSKMQEVIPNLLISNFFGARNIQEINKNKITHVVVCANELPEVFPSKLSYLKLVGLTDNTGTQLGEHLQRALPWIKESIEHGGRVLLHCASGSSRSGAMLTAYLMWDKNLSVHDALSKVKSVRPVVEPNPGFMEQLNEFSQSKEAIMELEKIYIKK